MRNSDHSRHLTCRSLHQLSRMVCGAGLIMAVACAPAAADEALEAAAAGGVVETRGRYVPTDEMVTSREMPKVRKRRASVKRRPAATAATADAGADPFWLFNFVERLIEKEPEAAKRERPRRAPVRRASRPVQKSSVVSAPKPDVDPVPVKSAVVEPLPRAVPQASEQRPTVVPPSGNRPIDAAIPAPSPQPQRATMASNAPVTVPQPLPEPLVIAPLSQPPTAPSQAGTPGPAIVTGAVPVPRIGSDAKTLVVTPDASEALVLAAERAQARADLVKLELASRTYNERRLSGQSVFDLRLDWRVLERARDALSQPEVSAADAAGFEANAYVNDATKTIVVAVAGSEDVRRDFLKADIWDALIRSQMPQHFFLAKTYTRSVMRRYQSKGYTTECVGHSLGGGACAYAASELGIRAILVNPISAGPLPSSARYLVTNYVVDGEIATLVYGARGNATPGDVQRISDGRDEARARAVEKYGALAGPILVVKTLSDAVRGHKIERALDLIAEHGGTERPR